MWVRAGSYCIPLELWQKLRKQNDCDFRLIHAARSVRMEFPGLVNLRWAGAGGGGGGGGGGNVSALLPPFWVYGHPSRLPDAPDPPHEYC